jgi:hypothetical protein
MLLNITHVFQTTSARKLTKGKGGSSECAKRWQLAHSTATSARLVRRSTADKGWVDGLANLLFRSGRVQTP